MKLLGVIVATLSTLASALPIQQSPKGTLTPRQSQYWNDEYIAKPKDFKATRIGTCNYQVAYRRDNGDGRYQKTITAFYGSSSRTVSGRTSANNFEFFAEYVGDLIVFDVRNACSGGSSGTEPTSFKIFFTLPRGQYTYVNDWTTDPIAPSAGPIPGQPTNVSAKKTSNARIVSVKWTPPSSQSGAYIKYSGLTRSSEINADVRYWAITTVNGATTSSASINGGRIDKVAVVPFASDSRLISDFTIVPIVAPAAA